MRRVSSYMKNINPKMLVMVLISILAAANNVQAQSSQFARVIVDGLLAVDVPRHWKLQNEDKRKNIASAVEAFSNKPTHVASLVAISKDAETYASLRVSMLADELTQEEFRVEYTKNPSAVLQIVKSEFQSSKFEALLAKSGSQLIGPLSVDIMRLNNNYAIAIVYKRSSAQGAVYVAQYHVPLRTHKALITVSYTQKDSVLFSPMVAKILASIQFY